MDIDSVLKELGQNKSPCPVYFHAENLRFYEPGAFFQQDDRYWIEINVKPLFFFLGYDLQRVLKHELIHAIRKDFEDSIFEELIAYQVSKFTYQKYLGPFFSLKRGKVCLILMPLMSLISKVLGGSFLFIFALASCLVTFLSYMPSYKKLERLKKKFIKEGKDPLIELMKMSKQDFDLS